MFGLLIIINWIFAFYNSIKAIIGDRDIQFKMYQFGLNEIKCLAGMEREREFKFKIKKYTNN
jgi:hypothetical protein